MHQPIQLKTKIQSRASALQITFSVALIFVSAILLAMATVQSVQAAVSESAAPKPTDARKPAPVELSTSSERVAGREIAGFSARQPRIAQERNLTLPAGLKPVEQEAWLAMARRQGASGGNEWASFYPKRYGEAFVVEGEGVRVALRPVAGTDVTAHTDDNGQVIYRQAYAETDSVHMVSAGRSEEFLFLQNECAPREFEYELSELSDGTRVELVNGEVRFTNEAGHGVKIEAPWLIEASGRQPAGAVRWELAQSKSGARPGLRLVVAQGLSYPVLIDPSWVPTGSLVAARDYHTATLLPSGKVLVAGGNGSGGFLTSAELYDPATGSWSSTGSLVGSARQDHTATLLPSGKVLVAGGYDGLSLSSAELYDPATGSWSSTSSLATARRWHTATLLPSGQVLVAGGFGNSGALSSAELYDPATGSWSSTGSLATPRSLHTGTLLPSGQVLVAGGYNGLSYWSSAELYDPATGSWSSTGNLGAARAAHTGTLLPSGQVLVAGGYNGSSELSSAELYDPATGSWSSTGSLPAVRTDHTATLLPSGQVLVAAGFNGRALNSAELYDPATGSWSRTSSLANARFNHTATLLSSGQVLVAGGKGSSGPLSSAELYESAIVSQITPAETTCSQFSSGTAENLGSLQYNVNNGLIGRVLPRSFLYWVRVTAPAGNNIFGIAQTITTGNFNTFFASNGNGSNVFDSNCVSLQRSVRQSGNTVTVKFNAPAAGTYFIAIAFNAQSIIGEPAPSPTTVHYDFTTTGVPDSTTGLDLLEQ